MTATSIGFTNGVAQSDTTKGRFKVYLQNTTDTTSRIDTAWTTLTAATNTIALTKLYPGKYEWQVVAVCSGTSQDTATAAFSNEYLSGCLPPTSLAATNITASTAILKWVAPASAPSKYFVLYSRVDSLNWKLDSTTSNTYNATGLTSNKQYQWRVWSKCAGDTSNFSSSNFATEAAVTCNAPTALAVGTVTETSAQLSWTAAAGANYYNIRYRRTGTTTWSAATSFTTSHTITSGLKGGTVYEWDVRAMCAAGSGAAVSGISFTTTGTAACYAPVNLTVDKITDSSTTLSWTASSGAASYKIRYRLKEAISWTNAVAPMTFVHNDSIIIPKVTGLYVVAFKGGSTFDYTGGGVYIAWEYERPSGALTSLNTALSNARANTILSLASVTDTTTTSHKEILSATSLRPETSLFASVQNDSVEVGAVYALGQYALGYTTGASISTRIINHKRSVASLSVTLTVKDTSNTVKYTATQTITVKSDSTKIVLFDGWVPTASATDSLIVSLPAETGETVLENNKAYYLQKVTTSFVAYDDGTQALTGAGYGTGEGLLLSRYAMKGCGSVHAAHIYLTPSAKNHAVYAVVLNAAGAVIASSDAFTPDSTQVNEYRSFYFTTPANISNADYYIGLAQTASTNGYYPVGVQWETTVPRGDAYYRASLSGGTLTNNPQPGRLMIRAEIAPGMATPYIAGNPFLCEGGSNTLKAASMTTRFANKLVAYSSQNSAAQFNAGQVLGTPSIYPAYVLHPNAWIGNSADGQREYVILGFANAAPINYINIYQTFGAGAVDTVFVKNPSTNLYEVVYSGTAVSTPDSVIKQLNFPLTSFNVSEVRIALNSPAVSGFNAIDAVAIGHKNEAHSYTSYLWTPGGAATSSISASAAGNYSVSVTDAAGCAATTALQVTTPVKIIPTISVTGSTMLCQGDSVKLTSSQANGNTWSTGQTTQSIFVKAGGSYTVSFNDGSGCGASVSSATVVTVNALPTVSISGNRFICSGLSTVLDAGVGFTNYLWSNGATTQTISVNTANVYTVTVTNSNGCKAKASITTALSQSPVPAITGSPAFCPGTTTTLDAGSGYAQYSWSTGATSQTISRGTAGLVSIIVTDSKGCTGSANVTTSQLTPPLPVISGTLSFCGGNSTTLDAGLGYSAYSWSNGATTRNITVTSVGTFTVAVTDSKGCTGSASATTTTQNTLPATPGPITGASSNVCNSTQTYTIAAVSNASRYVWTVPGGVTIISGAGTTSINVSFGSGFTGGDISVAAANSCGQSSSLNPSTLSIKAAPSMPGAVTGLVNGVCGRTNVAYSISAVAGATAYTWTLPAGATIVSGQGTTTVYVNFSSTFGSGNICVMAKNSCSSSGGSCIAVSSYPAAVGPVSGLTTVCAKQKSVTYSVSPVAGATSYTWTVPSQATITSGQGTNSVVVTFASKGGNITVAAKNNCGSTTKSLPVSVVTCSRASITNSERQLTSQEEQRYLGTGITASPNPTKGLVRLNFKAIPDGVYKLNIYDGVGKVVQARNLAVGSNRATADLSGFAKGVYLLNVTDEKKSWSVKVILE
jgi:hypothetical protein